MREFSEVPVDLTLRIKNNFYLTIIIISDILYIIQHLSGIALEGR